MAKSPELERTVERIKAANTFAVAFWREDGKEVLVEVQNEYQGQLQPPILYRFDSITPTQGAHSDLTWHEGARG